MIATTQKAIPITDIIRSPLFSLKMPRKKTNNDTRMPRIGKEKKISHADTLEGTLMKEARALPAPSWMPTTSSTETNKKNTVNTPHGIV